MRNILRLAVLYSSLFLTACGNAPLEAVAGTPDSAPAIQPTVAAAPSVSPTPSIPTATLVSTTTATSSAQTSTPASTGTATFVPLTATTQTATTEATATSSAVATGAPAPTPQSTATSATTAAPQVTAAATQTAGTTADGIAIRPDLAGTIAFVRNGSIFAYRPQDGTVKPLIENGRDVAFSRDGTQLAFVRDDGVFLAAADGSTVRQVAAQSNAAAPQWADDGSKVLFEANNGIWVVELPNGQPRRIVTGTAPAWAPDSKRIAYVTRAPDAGSNTQRRNQLRLTNWRGENDWPVVRALPPNTPATGVPGNELTIANLEHILLAPAWDATGKAIYAPAFVTSQVETDFTILERADATNGGATYIDTLYNVRNAIAAPDRRAVVLMTSSERGDVSLNTRALDQAMSPTTYAWATATSTSQGETFQFLSPAWSPDSTALVSFRCPAANGACDLVLLEPGATEPQVLIPQVVQMQGLGNPFASQATITWGP